MKKLLKALVVAGCACTVAASVAAFAGCGAEKSATGEAYGLAHTGGYVGYASVTVKGETIEDCILTEVCLPTYVTVGKGTSTESETAAAAAIDTTVPADDYVVVYSSKTSDETTTYTATAYYKTVKFGNITFIFDAEEATYKSGSDTMATVFANADNCKAYYDAVVSNSVKVSVGGEDKTDILTKAALCKDDNGYWASTLGVGLGWKANRDNTVKYVLENGVSGLLGLVKNSDGIWEDEGKVSTGATWSDLNSDTTGKGYVSYAQLLVNAYNAAK